MSINTPVLAQAPAQRPVSASEHDGGGVRGYKTYALTGLANDLYTVRSKKLLPRIEGFHHGRRGRPTEASGEFGFVIREVRENNSNRMGMGAPEPLLAASLWHRLGWTTYDEEASEIRCPYPATVTSSVTQPSLSHPLSWNFTESASVCLAVASR